MVRRVPAILAILTALSATAAIAQEEPLPLEGVVTHSVSFADFDANGLHVLIDPQTTIRIGNFILKDPTSDAPYVGENVSTVGKANRGKHWIKATEVYFRTPPEQQLSGFAVIDRVLPPPTSKGILIRANGYPILINSSTKISFNSPLTSRTGMTTNTWITFYGKLRNDGIVTADAAIFTPNVIHDREDKLLAKTDYDPTAVPDSSGQSGVSKYFLGVNPKLIPPYHDAAMQARINRIGANLVPEYQHDLPDTDETKIDFRFQLIDEPTWRNAPTTPGGIILVPKQIVERLSDDSELATILADGIASALEKQAYLSIPKHRTLLATELGGAATGLFVPGVGLVTSVVAYSSEKSIRSHELQQSGRVSLGLLHDAGYDLNAAPLAWWRISAKDPIDPTRSEPPERSLNLYKTIGEVWRTNSGLSTSPKAKLQ